MSFRTEKCYPLVREGSSQVPPLADVHAGAHASIYVSGNRFNYQVYRVIYVKLHMRALLSMKFPSIQES